MLKEKIPISVLDLVPISPTLSIREAFSISLALAKHTEKLGYNRYWLGELHLPGSATSATSILIGYLAAKTKRLRFGAGGVMLPNHSHLVIAEQFGTLISLFPKRIDLGLGRSSGTLPEVQELLRRNLKDVSECITNFPNQVEEMINWFDLNVDKTHGVIPQPGAGLKVPIWLLGSSLEGARLAANMGLPFVYAAHFSPNQLYESIIFYRENFKPSSRYSKPYVMVCLSVIAAESNYAARFLFLSFIHQRLGKSSPLPHDYEFKNWAPTEEYGVPATFKRAIIGDKAKVMADISLLINELYPDEIMINCPIYGRIERLNSYTLMMEAFLTLFSV